VVPSGGVDADRLAAGVAVLERRGFEVTVRSPSTSYRYFSGRDEERRHALLEAFGDPTVRAVWLARGGYGMNRLLPGLDAEWLREHGKLCIGFSDATALLQVLVQRAGVAAIHGPMVAHDVAREEEGGGLDHLLAIASGACDWSIDVPRGIAMGEATAPLLGGCLAILTSLAGTPFAPSFHARSLSSGHQRASAAPHRPDARPAPPVPHTRRCTRRRLRSDAGCGPTQELIETIADCLGDLGVPIGFGAPWDTATTTSRCRSG
jgi:muramoyltetrapeptide carboxypeptidase